MNGKLFFRFFDLNRGAVAGVSPVKTLRDCSRHGCLYRLRGWRGLL